MVDKKKAEKYLDSKFNEFTSRPGRVIREKYINIIIERHNANISFVMDIINHRISIDDIEDFDVFVLIEGLDIINNTNERKLYFETNELNSYSKMRYKSDNFQFPIEIPCIQISNDQYIGFADAQFYMKLRKAQLIRYNTEAQRVMKMCVNRKDGIETWTIAVNKRSVKEIKEQMKARTYIPDELTLNIPEDSECKIKYEDNKLIINDIDHFDISDGYHRYLAMGELYDEDPSFNYPMEIRIIRYPLVKVKRLIHQKDQKTKMRKIDSDSMNMDSFANIISEQLNDTYGSTMFVLHGKISRNEGIVRLPELAKIIEFLYRERNGSYKSVRKMTIKEISHMRDNIKDGLNEFFINVYPDDVETTGKKVDYQDLCLAMYMVKNNYFAQYNTNTLQQKFLNASSVIHNEKKEEFRSHSPKKKQFEIIESLLKQ